MPPHVCVVGSSNIDLTFRTARLPQPGETLSGRAFQLGYGGKGANQAVMAARLGARVTMVSRVGPSPTLTMLDRNSDVMLGFKMRTVAEDVTSVSTWLVALMVAIAALTFVRWAT